ncbi:MAG: hypothetical protein V3575_04050, partial [Candidatus Absconditabacteria bacterium]
LDEVVVGHVPLHLGGRGPVINLRSKKYKNVYIIYLSFLLHLMIFLFKIWIAFNALHDSLCGFI